MDEICSEERALIEDHLRERGVTRVGPGVTAAGFDYVWDGQRLISADPRNRGWGSAGGRPGSVRQPARGQYRSEEDILKDKEIAQAIRDGLSGKQIAHQLDTSAARVRRIARRHGLKQERGESGMKGAELPLDEAVTARILPFVDGQRSVTQIARLSGCTIRTVRLRQKRLGLDIPDKRSARA
ncbi:hypothetical protein [Pseudooceanicola algae]|uniref:Uncharacterized protein n=1 Tax=Pseudooceanicola algae TaxID=1537215 RepID=A0A418SDA5_9RHOB|nr:hypothetical protein [Pseudooceanicola algae]QPM89365.1 hypothetical protein PSAL_005810 [Pseudooceanicola algae]